MLTGVPVEEYLRTIPLVGWLEAYLVWGFYALPIAYLAEVVLGIAAWMALRRYGVRSYLAFAGVGALLGWLVNLGLEAWAGNLAGGSLATLFNPWATAYLPLSVAAGALAAITFRAIAGAGSLQRAATASQRTAAF